MVDYRQGFGRALFQFRAEAGLSQEELAGEAGIDRTYISLLERGLRAPGLNILFALAPPLGKEPYELVQATQELAGRASRSRIGTRSSKRRR